MMQMKKEWMGGIWRPRPIRGEESHIDEPTAACPRVKQPYSTVASVIARDHEKITSR